MCMHSHIHVHRSTVHRGSTCISFKKRNSIVPVRSTIDVADQKVKTQRKNLRGYLKGKEGKAFLIIIAHIPIVATDTAI